MFQHIFSSIFVMVVLMIEILYSPLIDMCTLLHSAICICSHCLPQGSKINSRETLSHFLVTFYRL